MSDIFKAIISGIIEGLTEFLPVSSTAHLLLFSWLANFNLVQENVFEVVIQLGAILAICVIYRARILQILCEFKKKTQQKFILNLFLAFMPAALIGFAFHGFIKKVLFSNLYIAFALIFGGIIMIIIDRKKIKYNTDNLDKITPSKALAIGIFQSFAIIPGVSRSGATIIGGLLLGLNRKIATEFSFFLAIPTIAAASIYDLYKNINQISFENFEIIAIGFVAAFLSAMVVIKWFINYVAKHNFVPFAIYRIALGTLLLFYLYL